MSVPTRDPDTARSTDRLFLVLVFIVSGTLFGIGMGVLLPLVFVGYGTGDVALVAGVLSGLLFGVVMTGFFARTWRSAGGRSGAVELQTAMRSGSLPADADPETWTARLAGQERQDTSSRRSAVVFGILACFYIVLALAGSPALWWGAPLFLGLAVLGWSNATRNRAKTARLRAELEAQGVSDGEPS